MGHDGWYEGYYNTESISWKGNESVFAMSYSSQLAGGDDRRPDSNPICH